MINKDLLAEALAAYKESFPNHWKDEQYKWEAVQWFQQHWNVNAVNFADMLEVSLSKTYNLLASMNNFPARMIIEFAKTYPEDVRAMFLDLFDETEDVYERIKQFKSKADELLVKIFGNKSKQHYQGENAISTYLWLAYPDKYYIYKYGVAKTLSAKLKSNYQIKQGAYADNIRNYLKLYDEVSEVMQADVELGRMLSERITDICYPDSQLRIMTVDFGFFLYQQSIKDVDESIETLLQDEVIEKEKWLPKTSEYVPGLSKDKWLELLNKPNLFRKEDFDVLFMLFENNGIIDEIDDTILRKCSWIGRQVFSETKCHVYKPKQKYWPILLQFKESGTKAKSIRWRIRPELYNALSEFGIDKYQRKKQTDSPVIWKISHGTDATGVSKEIKEDLLRRNVVGMHGETRAKATSKITQGEAFRDSIRKGDYFYLCYGVQIKLLGRFTTDDAVENPDIRDGWFERKYEVIAETVSDKPYDGVQKWWTPNDNSTCIQVDDLPLFETTILQPYFNMTLEKLMGKKPTPTEQPQNYWWLNANPKIWSFASMAVGEEQDYTLYNENGHKRRIFQNFLDAKEGDMVIGYESNPVKQVVGIAVVSKEQDGESLYFRKVEGLSTPIDYQTLKACPELANMEYFVNPQGSLFKLTKDEYEFIMDVIREENPIEEKTKIEPYTKADFLEDVFMTENQYKTLAAILKKKKNVILQGAPGVGKTFAATRLAYAMMGEKDDSRIELIQFHQNYSYEDFMMGYKPAGEGFELKYGIFYRFCQRAANQPGKDFFFIIDEINRGNMSKIFGELLMSIEKDYRTKPITLAYTGMPFSVPENLHIIGMMNTADRSLAMIDYALRRRFSFFAMEPGFDTEGFLKKQKAWDSELLDALLEQVKELNKRIASDKSLGKGFCIGHSYFCGLVDCSETELRAIVEYDILPMLSEYWFDEPTKLQEWENRLRGVFQK